MINIKVKSNESIANVGKEKKARKESIKFESQRSCCPHVFVEREDRHKLIGIDWTFLCRMFDLFLRR